MAATSPESLPRERNRAWAAQLLAGARNGRAPDDADAVAVITNLLEMVQTLRDRNEQLESALQSRVAIEQAKGVLAERLGVDPEDAFVLLRTAARSARVKLRDLAWRVVASPETPEEIASLVDPLEQRAADASADGAPA